MNHTFLPKVPAIAVELFDDERRQTLYQFLQNYLEQISVYRTYYGILCQREDRWFWVSHALLFFFTLVSMMLIVGLAWSSHKLPTTMKVIFTTWAFASFSLAWVTMEDVKRDNRLKLHKVRRDCHFAVMEIESMQFLLKHDENLTEHEYERWSRKWFRNIAHIISEDPRYSVVWEQAKKEEAQRQGRKT